MTAHETITALLEGDAIAAVLLCPSVGTVLEPPADGALVRAGQPILTLDVLGRARVVVAPPEAIGTLEPLVKPEQPLGFGDPVARLRAVEGQSVVRAREQAAGQTTLAFRSPMAGRFYGRPAPDKPAFVKVGDRVTRGQTLGLLEVMKTFHRLTYGGDDLPDEARIVAIRVRDDDDIDADAPLFDLE